MSRFVKDPFIEAYYDMLKVGAAIKFAEIPDIDDVSDSEGVGVFNQSILNECKADADSVERYIVEMIIPELQRKIAKLPAEYAPSIKKHVSSKILKVLEQL